jgi:extracellular factor (EF) 3-hydroxypalmitic acid methyl ester biosynthesis protein
MNTKLSEVGTDNFAIITDYLKILLDKGGPEPQDYERLTSIVDNLEPSKVDSLREVICSILNESTLIGHGFVKPFGYPGDFTLIDKIYRFSINQDVRFRNWDLWFQNHPAATAVRNRKDFFIEYCKKLVEIKKASKVLVLGSGPASDVYEFLSKNPCENRISFDLIDFDQAAIDFSMNKNRCFNSQITYNRINALRFNSYQLYDLIWSAGLFDYFKDKHFTFLIRKYINCLADDGEMIISNFSTRNPSKKLMEVLSDWYLNLRTESDLYRIASDANIDKELVIVDKEPLGINLFLKIRKN